MSENHLLRMYPTLQIVAEELCAAGLSCRTEGTDDGRSFRSARLFTAHCAPQPDILYILRAGDVPRFPTDRFSYICCSPAPGSAGHIFCPDRDPEELLELTLDLFSRYQQLEARLDELVYRNAGLHELCELGAQMLENPICIHDDWFIMLAMSQELPKVIPPEYIMSSTKEFVPQFIVDDFKYDSDYQATYSHRTTQLWSDIRSGNKCLYVNLWDGSVYRGRLLVVQYHRDFRSGDYLLAQVLTQRAAAMLRRNLPGTDRPFRSMDDVVYELLHSGASDAQEVNQLINMLGWSKKDTLVCILVKNQQPGVSDVMNHVLHSDLFRSFPNSYIMFAGSRQCVILNVSQETTSLPSALRHRLAPLCRDYCLYAGISSPVNGIQELHIAHHQADVALERAFRLRSDQWMIPFSDCALDYMLDNFQPPLQLPHLAAPELYLLIDHDREKGTQYFETLRVYLTRDRDIPRTSETLIIHRTTLLYRLKKIRALTELDLDDPDVRLYLLLSLRILDREKLTPDGI